MYVNDVSVHLQSLTPILLKCEKKYKKSNVSPGSNHMTLLFSTTEAAFDAACSQHRIQTSMWCKGISQIM